VSRNFDLLQRLNVDVESEPLADFMPADQSPTIHADPPKSAAFLDMGKHTLPRVDLHVTSNRAAQAETLKLVHGVFLSHGSTPRRAVVFAAIDPGNGCSQICGLAARALAASVRTPVCLVDANFRNSHGSSSYNAKNFPGLADALRSPGPIQDFMLCAGPHNLALLPRGVMTGESFSFLNSRSLKGRMEDLRSEFAYVLIDAPPMNSYADAVTLAQLADGIVLVLEAHSTRRESALKITEQLRAAGIAVLGGVLNKRTFPIPETLYHIL